MFPETKEQLIRDMKACPQTQGMSVLDHGDMVQEYYYDLINHLRDHYNVTKLNFEWKLPEWIYTHRDLILSKLYNDEIMDAYTLYHDCGKPYCRTVDADGKQHFPDHANVSYQVWTKLFADNPNTALIGNLIKMDMDIHCLKSEQLEAFAERPEAISLLITGLCEIHANASMFGGVESTSFKIKWKQIDKRGRQILAKIV
jgi:hypothetical protein